MEQPTPDEVQACKRELDRIIGQVCGACELNCCLQGTMAGSDDARRIAKECRRSPEARERLVSGIRERSRELRRDLEGLRSTSALLRARFGSDMAEDLQRLSRALDQWSAFCDFLDGEFTGDLPDLQRCLLFSGIRATALRAMGAFPGGVGVLPTLAGRGTSFQVGRRGMKPDRCLFHVGACIVPDAKPRKCADFYCATEPGLIDEVVSRMSCDEFVLAQFRVRERADLMADLETELSMGADFATSKVILGGDADLGDEIAARLGEHLSQVEQVSVEGGHLDAQVDIPRFSQDWHQRALVLRCGSVDAVNVYELAVALVRTRGESIQPVVIVLAGEWTRCAAVEPALWQGRAISQPLSAVDLYAVRSGQGTVRQLGR